MGTRNFSLGARNIRAAGRIALEKEMCSFSSISTMSYRWNRFIHYLLEHSPVGRLEHIRQDMIIAYGEWLATQVADGLLSVATAHNYVSAVNRVMEIARGDRDLTVSPIRDCGIPPRTGIAVEFLFVSATEHDNWMTNLDARLRLMLQLQREFGLRFEESAKIDTRHAEKALETNILVVANGTKGGRKREIEIRTDEQRNLLKEVICFQGSARSLIPEDMSYAEFRDHCYRIAAQNGIRFHRQRHTYACHRYKELVGADCPVIAGIAHGKPHIIWLAGELKISETEARELDHFARKQIAEELGHNRLEVTNEYVG